VLQACLEAVCYRFALVARLIDDHLDESRMIVASGGALTASPAWVQMMADVLQHNVRLSHEAELTSRGAAILALRAMGSWASLDEVALPLEETCAPDASRADVYGRAIDRQRGLYQSLIGGGEAAPRPAPRASGPRGPATRGR
jgi:gluconokinase